MKNNIKYFIMDVDGTLTDGKIYMGTSSEFCKTFNIKDGYGIHDILIPAGITPVIMTGRRSEIVLNRCKELGITEVYQDISNKTEQLQFIVEDLSTVAYIGDDLNDYSCMLSIKNAGGLIGCPKDADKKIIKIVNYVAKHNGGNGAVRDFIEWIFEG